MKIRKIMVNGFGKLTDRSYSLSDGLNVIYGNNEAGRNGNNEAAGNKCRIFRRRE